jgi:hypothetical protein
MKREKEKEKEKRSLADEVFGAFGSLPKAVSRPTPRRSE